MSKEMQKVILYLDPIEVIVEKGKTVEETLENAKKATKEQLKERFSRFQYSLVELNALSMEKAKPGMVVELDGEVGIITVLNRKNIKVIISGNRSINGAPEAFKLSNKSYKEAMVPRRVMEDMEEYYEGDCGYILYQGEEVPVVNGKKVGNKYRLWSLKDLGYYFDFTKEQLIKRFKDIN
ncbi:hypothetical protein F6Y05_35335 [Bacillus megaterium]|nr:hypothetical protein [Priestia megaterium]